MEIIITDLTRFNTAGKVCIAGINLSTNECIRPMPYLTDAECKKFNILPGEKFSANFSNNNHRGQPHIEDSDYDSLSYLGPCTAEEFHQVLNNSLSTSIANGFGYEFPEGGRIIPHTNPPSQSIITLKVDASQIQIVKDGYQEGKIKLNLKDNDGKKYSYMPITDLGFYNYAMEHFNDPGFPENINTFLKEQDEIYLRIGLSNIWESPDGRKGYWIQANGIYTFPNFNTEIRSY